MKIQDDILKVIAHEGTMKIVETVAMKTDAASFSSLMFETQMNPGVLNRLLKEQVQLGILVKSKEGYTLTEKGKKVLELVTAIRSL